MSVRVLKNDGRSHMKQAFLLVHKTRLWKMLKFETKCCKTANFAQIYDPRTNIADSNFLYVIYDFVHIENASRIQRDIRKL